MLSSGAGSLFSRRWLSRTELAWMPISLVIGILLMDVLFLPHWLEAWVGFGLSTRIAISSLLLAPLGFLMGMPFPTGLRALAARSKSFFGRPAEERNDDNQDNAVEWAWAMNAAASVLGSVLAMVIAIQFGLNATLACGVFAYLIALTMLPTLRPPARAQ
jgi:hypothetical protein